LEVVGRDLGYCQDVLGKRIDQNNLLKRLPKRPGKTTSFRTLNLSIIKRYTQLATGYFY
jgi:hypothetical protein